eukprot:COSAG02_NODE_10022_length_2046_cov_2.352337_2_plen_357_part_00
MLTPSLLRKGDCPALFDPPAIPRNEYLAPATGSLPLPSLLTLTREDADALPDCCEWLPEAEGCAEVVVIGTAHVSNASVSEVADAIAALRPDAVLVELCSGRTQMLEKIDIAAPPSLELMLQQIQAGADLFSVVYPWFLATVAESLDVVPGAEFRAAFLAASRLSMGDVLYSYHPETHERKFMGYMSEADAIDGTRQALVRADTAAPQHHLVIPPSPNKHDNCEEEELSQEQQLWVTLYNARAACACPVVLADRHISATVSRVWGSLTPWDRARLLGGFLWQGLALPDAEELKDQTEGMKGKQGKDLITEAVAELSEEFPAFTAVLIDERDEWLAQQLYSCARNDVIQRTDESEFW